MKRGMKVAIEIYATIMILVIGVLLLLQIFVLGTALDNAHTYLRKAVSKIEFENTTATVVADYEQEAADLGYGLEYVEYHNIIRGCKLCNYVFRELDTIDVCVSCGGRDVIEERYSYGELKLIYDLVVPILGLRKETYLIAYVR